jgi:hypothetical protein
MVLLKIIRIIIIPNAHSSSRPSRLLRQSAGAPGSHHRQVPRIRVERGFGGVSRIGQLTDVLQCNLHEHFLRNQRQLRDHMNAMAQTQVEAQAAARATVLHHRRVRLTREPASASLARVEVRAAIRAWRVPVDPDVAVLLASDLVTHAIIRGEGTTTTVAIRYSHDRLRVDVYDTWRALPVQGGAVDGLERGAGLALLATLADEWGTFRTPAGMAVYFALETVPLTTAPELPPGPRPLGITREGGGL